MKILLKKLSPFVYLTAIAALLVLALSGCNSSSSPASSPSSTKQETLTPSVQVLTVVKDAQTVSYTLESLKALPAISGWAGQISSTGKITGPDQYKGVNMGELLKGVGGLKENNAIRVSAKDGYTMTLSYNQVTTGSGFPTLDSTTGKEVIASATPAVFVAYEQNGKPLDDTLGPLRLGVMSSQTQVTDGHWWVKWTQKIEVIAATTPAPSSAPAASTSAIPAAASLVITKGSQTKTYSPGDSKALTPTSGYGGQKNKAGVITGPVQYKGVALIDLLNAVGGINDANSVKVTASDGYTKTLTFKQATQGDFPVYDTAGNTATAEIKPAVVVAYERDGKALDDKTGPFAIGVMTSQNQVTDGSSWVNLVVKIEIVAAQ